MWLGYLETFPDYWTWGESDSSSLIHFGNAKRL